MKKSLMAGLMIPFYFFASYSYLGEEKTKDSFLKKPMAKVTTSKTKNLPEKNLIEQRVQELEKYNSRQLEGMFDRKLEMDRKKYEINF